MTDRYDVTVRRINESKDDPDPISIGQAYTVTLDEFGTLTIEAAGTIRSFPRGAWTGFTGSGMIRQTRYDRPLAVMPWSREEGSHRAIAHSVHRCLSSPLSARSDLRRSNGLGRSAEL
jgi:hypothetical protein